MSGGVILARPNSASAGAAAASGTAYFTLLDDTTTTDVIYMGEAANGTATSAASWRISKLDQSNGLSLTRADGNENFDNVWDNRASLTYS